MKRGAMIAILPLTLLACERVCMCHMRDMDTGGAGLAVRCDWSAFEDDELTGMTGLVYGKNGGLEARQSAAPEGSVKVSVKDGCYDVVIFNQSEREFTGIAFEGLDSLHTALAYGIERQRPEGLPLEGQVIYEPEPFGIGAAHDVMATGHGGNACKCRDCECSDMHEPMPITEVEVTPHVATWTVNVEVRVKGGENLLGVRGALGGLESAIQMSAGMPQTDSHAVVQLLSNWVVSGDGRLSVSTRCLGIGNRKWLPLYLEFMLVDGETIVTYTANMVEHLRLDPATHTARIAFELPNPLPDVEMEGGGFNASVNDWDEEEVIYVS